MHDLAGTDLAPTVESVRRWLASAIAERWVAKFPPPLRRLRAMHCVRQREVQAHVFVERPERILENALAHAGNEAVIKRQVVNRQQMPAEEFVGFHEVMQVGARMFAASLTRAAGIKRLLGEFVNGTPEMKFALGREHRSTLCELRRDDAVEEIDAAMHRLEDVEGSADAHQVPGKILG